MKQLRGELLCGQNQNIQKCVMALSAPCTLQIANVLVAFNT